MEIKQLNERLVWLANSNSFNGIFNKYDSEDLIDKLIQNIAIVEYL